MEVIWWLGCDMLVLGVEHVKREGMDMLDRKRSTCWWGGVRRGGG